MPYLSSVVIMSGIGVTASHHMEAIENIYLLQYLCEINDTIIVPHEINVYYNIILS